MALSKAYSDKSQNKRYGYYRVSTPDQKIAQQITALREYGCDEILGDKGVSGKVFDRKKLNALLDKLKPGDEFAVQRVDRLGRSVYHLTRLLHLFEERDVRLVSITQGFDVKTASGKMMFNMFATIAEFESDLNGERTKGGLKSRKAKGVKLGRKPKLDDTDIIKAALMLSSNTISKVEVANQLNVSPRTLSRSLKNFSPGQA